MSTPITIPAGFDINQAVTCTRLIATAYDMYAQWKVQHDPGSRSFDWQPKFKHDSASSFVFGKPLWGKSGGILWKDKEPFAFVASDRPVTDADKTVYLAIRGTQSGANWLSNLRADDTRYRLAPGYGQVHEGFYELYKSMAAAVLKELRAVGNIKQLVICGHSLGAALSTLAAAHVLNKCDVLTKNAKLWHYNLASPRVATPHFATVYDNNGIATFRIVNVEDIVPNVPPAIMGSDFFQHIGVPVTFSANYESISANHNSDKSYLYALENPQAPQGNS
jgi:hypothetical protein